MSQDSDEQVICPVCKHVITDFEEGVSDPCEHVMLTYVDMLNGEFVHVHNDFEGIAEDMLEKAEDYDNYDVSIEELLEQYVAENKNFIVEILTTYGMACGPCSSSEYHLIRLK